MADEERSKAATDSAGLARTQIAADSISRTLVMRREQLHKDLASLEEVKTALDARRAALDAEWLAFNQERAKHRDILARHEQDLDDLANHELSLNQLGRELNVRELRLKSREEKLGALETDFHARNTALADRQAAVEAGERDLAERKELHRVGMHQLRHLIQTEFFREPGK